jgi:Protein of unknown function (DUF1592)/Protein of unknown function (DUF1588)/Protein of unknown function (DUF1585)/Protein of unknown function (DUF1587)/Protein of unknown function (DUF1595)/Planctomycete cytochrome C
MTGRITIACWLLAAGSALLAQPALVDKYCVACHNQRAKIAELALDKADVANPSANAETWEKVIGKLRSNAMPPPGLPRPDKTTRDTFVKYLETSIDRAAIAKPNPGRTVLHRMNRAEYGNAIRDLLGVEVDAASLLPTDDSGFGFDNIADVLSVSPMLTERYLAATRKISRLAIGDPTIQPATEVFPVSKLLKQDDRVSEDLPFGSRAGLAVRYYFPVDGDYVVKIFLLRTYDGKIRGTSEPHQLEVRVNGERMKQFTVGAAAEAGRGRGLRQEADGMEVRFTAKAGPGLIGVTFIKEAGMPEGMLRPKYPITSYEYAGDSTIAPGIANVEIRGPYDVRGPGSSPSRERIFVCHQDDERCARQILSAIARRAFRRPVNDAELEPLMAFYRAARAKSSFDAGIEMALQRILVSPDFLFRIERDSPNATHGTPHRISDLELASRLSFFLWSSIPDDELLNVAARGQLKQPAILEQQVRRMLADNRSKAWVRNFMGQWLYLRNIELAAVDPAAFPDFDGNLREAFAKELEQFLDSQVREDRSISELLTADYTYVNERLAQHYGIPNVYGSHFRRVTLTDDVRKGLLGKGGILMVTSYANRTSPVKRGKWLLENILNAPPPPPLPNVPSLKENAAGAKPQSVRERLEEHRSNPACAGCHKIMDPLGFALENFDAVGQWRSVSEAGTPIDASGELLDGTKLDGPASLRDALLGRREDFALTVTEKLLTYALGRGAEYFDKPAIRQIVRESAGKDYKWSAVVLGIVRSTPFQMRMPEN